MNKNFFFLRFGEKCIYIGPVHMVEITSTFETPTLKLEEEYDEI